MIPPSALPISAGRHDGVPLVVHRNGTEVRERIHGLALMVMGGVAVSTGLLVLDAGLASIVGAGMDGYGVYLCLR